MTNAACWAWPFIQTTRRIRACSSSTRARKPASSWIASRSSSSPATARWIPPRSWCCSTSTIRPATTTAATSPLVPMGCSTSASVTAAAATIPSATSAMARTCRPCWARCCASMSRPRTRPRRTRFPPPIRSPRTRAAMSRVWPRAMPAARRSTPMASAIPGAGVLIAAAPMSCGSTMWARVRSRKSTASCSAAITAGGASKAPTTPGWPVARIPIPLRPWRSTAGRKASRPRADTCIAAARFPRCTDATCSAISAARCGASRGTRRPR